MGWETPRADARFEAWPAAAANDPSPVIEELTTTPVGSVGRPVDRRLGLVVGLIAAVVGFGFMSRDVHVATPRGADDDRSPIGVSSSADPAPTDIPAGPTVVLVGSGAPAFGTTVSIGIVDEPGGTSWLTVDASGMSSVGVLDIEARTAASDLVACGSVGVATDDERPASDGGVRVTVGSVHARIPIRRHQSPGTLGVTIQWRDGRAASTWPMSALPGCRTAAR